MSATNSRLKPARFTIVRHDHRARHGARVRHVDQLLATPLLMDPVRRTRSLFTTDKGEAPAKSGICICDLRHGSFEDGGVSPIVAIGEGTTASTRGDRGASFFGFFKLARQYSSMPRMRYQAGAHRLSHDYWQMQ